MLIIRKIPINNHTQKIGVNKFARKTRHRKNFSKVQALSGVFTALPLAWSPPKFKTKAVKKRKTFSEKDIIKRAFALATFVILATSFSPNIAFSDTGIAFEQMSAFPTMDSTIIADDSGFLLPTNPQTNEADRTQMSDKAVHTVQSGETLSVIAEDYGLKTKTLMWENNIASTGVLKVGQDLVVPPVDGVTHEVKSGQTLAKIATLYDIGKEDIIRQNAMATETISAGDLIFVPGGTQIAPPAPVLVASRNTAAVRTTAPARVALEGTVAAPAVGKFLIYPTRGNITQGYHSWHRAIDIADVSKPPIWAAAGGTITKASSGTWGGGYGNHVIIDHGNGVQTLYAHLDYLTVSNGQYVTQGEVIGRMGNTGRVYGRTGIHLHFEVRENGIKMVPSNYW